MKKYRYRPCGHCGAPKRLVSGAWLREQRRARGLTMAALACRLGCSVAYINHVEHETRDARDGLAARFVAAMKGAPV